MNTRPALLTPGDLVVGALVGVALAVGLFLYLQRPAIRRTTVLASLPWVAVGAAIHALDGVVGYPDALARLLEFPWAYLLAATLAGLTWLLVTSVVDSESRAVRPHYVGVIGCGTLLPPVTVLVVRAGAVAPERLAVWLVVPIMAALATYPVMIGLGLWMPESGYFAGPTGAVVTFGLAVDGIGTALAFGFGARIVAPIGIPLGPVVGLSAAAAHPLAVVWAVVWLRLAVAVGALGVLTALERWRPSVAERGLELLTVASGVVAANTFLFALGGRFA